MRSGGLDTCVANQLSQHQQADSRRYKIGAEVVSQTMRSDPKRLHSTLGYRSPIEIETDWYCYQIEVNTGAA